jgi:hypothetical protein
MSNVWQPHKPPKDYADRERQRRLWQSQPPVLADWIIEIIAAAIIAALWVGIWIVYK